jgi:hypothetical protein
LRSPLNLVGGSFVPLIKGGRGIRLYVAISPSGAAPNTDAWHLKFDGHIDTLDLANGDSTIGLQARDLGGRLQATQIEASRVYGSDAGVAVEAVIQSILDDNNTGVTLVVPASPGWDLHKYQQDKTNVMDAIRALASQIGWELRYRWNAVASRFDLTLWDIDRAKTTADDTITPAQVRAWKSANEDVTTIRNVVTVVYKVDTTTGERSSYTATDSTSIADNGRMACEVVEDASSQIDDEATAGRMATAILADLKDTLIAGSADTIPRPHAELGDLLTFTADNTPLPRWSDIDQTLAVVGVQDDFTVEVSSTTLSLRGKPSGGFERWLQLEARKGIGSNRALVAVDGASGESSGATLGGITIVYDEPTTVNWVYSELYLSTVSGFTPDASTFYTRGRTTTFTIGGLIPGTTYYAKVVVVDSAGNRSTASTQAVVAAALVGPAHVDHGDVSKLSIPNGSFSVTSPPAVVGTNPPDSWTPCYARSTAIGGGVNAWVPTDYPAVWGNGAALDTSANRTGGAALILSPTTLWSSPVTRYGVRSPLVPCSILASQYIRLVLKMVTGGGAPGFLYVQMFYYDRNKNFVGPVLTADDYVRVPATPDTDWRTAFADAVGAPPNAAWVSVGLMLSTADSGTLEIDQVEGVDPAALAASTSVRTKQLLASSTLNAALTTDMLNVTTDDPAAPAFQVTASGVTGIHKQLYVDNGGSFAAPTADPVAKFEAFGSAIQLEPNTAGGTQFDIDSLGEGDLCLVPNKNFGIDGHRRNVILGPSNPLAGQAVIPSVAAGKALKLDTGHEVIGFDALSAPSGTGWVHVTDGAVDGAASTPTYADVGAAAASHTQAVSTISDATTVGQSLVKLTNPSAVTFPRINADNTVTARSAAQFAGDIGSLSNPMDGLGQFIYGAVTTGAPTKLAAPSVDGFYVLSETVIASTPVAPAWTNLVASATPGADTFVISGGSGKIDTGWIDTSTVGGASKIPQYDTTGALLITDTAGASQSDLVIQSTTNSARIELQHYGIGNPAFTQRFGGGTPASPTATLTGATVLVLQGSGWDNAGTPAKTSPTVRFGGVAKEDYTTTAQGTKAVIETTATGATGAARAVRCTIDEQGVKPAGLAASRAAVIDANGAIASGTSALGTAAYAATGDFDPAGAASAATGVAAGSTLSGTAITSSNKAVDVLGLSAAGGVTYAGLVPRLVPVGGFVPGYLDMSMGGVAGSLATLDANTLVKQYSAWAAPLAATPGANVTLTTAGTIYDVITLGALAATGDYLLSAAVLVGNASGTSYIKMEVLAGATVIASAQCDPTSLTTLSVASVPVTIAAGTVVKMKCIAGVNGGTAYKSNPSMGGACSWLVLQRIK